MADRRRRRHDPAEVNYVEGPQRDYTNPLEALGQDPGLIRRHFRLDPETILWLCALLAPDLRRKLSFGLPILIQVCVTLKFLGSGGFHINNATNNTINVSTSSAWRSVENVTKALGRRLRREVKFPSTAVEINRVKAGFRRIAGFPGIIGCLDGTFVPLDKRPSEHPQAYYCRKQFYALNAQMTCDHRRVITYLNCAWPGSVHDSRAFRNSNLYRYLDDGHGEGHLLGDSAYALRNFLLTPYLHPTTPAQEHYNEAHRTTRALIEQTFGVLKRRFAVLHIGFRCTVERAQACLKACVILHNLCMDHGDHDYDDGGDYDQARRRRQFHGDDGNIAPDGFNGRRVREMITERHFTY